MPASTTGGGLSETQINIDIENNLENPPEIETVVETIIDNEYPSEIVTDIEDPKTEVQHSKR
jgi:hypothetical protein